MGHAYNAFNMSAIGHRIFLLSPAHCGGKRAGYVLNDAATFNLARQIRSPRGAELGDVFAFLSGLYFRGKLAYAKRFGNAPCGLSRSYVITTNRGLVPPETPIKVAELREMGCGDIDATNPNYRNPLLRDLRRLIESCHHDCEFVLLGSIATAKYVEPLLELLGERLLFPTDFIG